MPLQKYFANKCPISVRWTPNSICRAKQFVPYYNSIEDALGIPLVIALTYGFRLGATAYG
jgi:hypothetical protein